MKKKPVCTSFSSPIISPSPCNSSSAANSPSSSGLLFGMRQLLLTLVLLLPLCLAVREQSIAVKGRLLCGDQPAANVRVKLWEEDSGPDPDDLLEAGYTDANGEFQLQGGTVETTPIDPVLKVYHDCNDVTGFLSVPKPGSRKVKFSLPDKYISEGMIPQKVMDIGTINLEIEFQGEEREFIVD